MKTILALFYLIFLNNSAESLNVITLSDMNGDRLFRSQIKFDDKNKLVWTGWESMYIEEKDWDIVFVETATRQE